MEIFWSTKLKLPNERAFKEFVQTLANRAMQGFCRYGPPHADKRYLERLEKEVKAYKRTGNQEHLLNAANYCHLEMFRPMHPKAHMDNRVGSVTRGRKDQ